MTEPIYQPKNPSLTVTCAHCGAVIDRATASPTLTQAQAGEVVDMGRRYRCADRERCEARGPIAQTAEQLRADLEAAQTVIESQRVRIDALVADEIETRALVNTHLEELARDLQAEKDRYCSLMKSFKTMRQERDVARRETQDARGAQTHTATEAREELERQARARLVREVEFVRAVRALALDGTGRPNCTINTLLSMTTKAMQAIEQDQAIEHPAQARVRELEAARARMIEDLHDWLGEQIRTIDAVCTSDEMRRRLEDALTCLRSGSEWIR